MGKMPLLLAYDHGITLGGTRRWQLCDNRVCHLPCVTIIAAASSLPTDHKSRMRGIVCVLTRPIESAVYGKENKTVSMQLTLQ